MSPPTSSLGNTSRSQKNHRNSPKSRGSPSPSPAPKVQRTQNKTPNPLKAVQTSINWHALTEITIRVDTLPLDVTTKQMWRWFHIFGNVVWLDIFNPGNGAGYMSAKVRFEPAPAVSFWEMQRVVVDHPDHARYPDGLATFVTVLHEPIPLGPGAQEHPNKMQINLNSVHFGSRAGPRAMNIADSLFPSNLNNGEELSLHFDARAKKMAIHFVIPGARRCGNPLRQFKFVVDTVNLNDVFYTKSNNGCLSLTMTLPFPPEYHWKKENIEETCTPDKPTWSIRDAWYRATDIALNLDASLAYPVAVYNGVQDPAYIEIGRWTTFQLVVEDSLTALATFKLLKIALKDLNIVAQYATDFEFYEDKDIMWKLINQGRPSDTIAPTALMEMSSNVLVLPFELRYQLEVCISRGVLNEHNVDTEFLRRLAAMNPLNATRRLEYLADRREPLYRPNELFDVEDAEAFLPLLRVPHYCTMVRKAVITPTTMRLNTPTIETSNRVVRKYSQVSDRFLRVQFVEEGENRRITINKSQNDDIWKRVYRTLYQGIQIGDRHYEFLAFGSSQLRQCGAYFFAPTDHISCDDIRQWMGQFRHIKIVAKYAARLGQCFSTTREIRGIHVPAIRPIPDVSRNNYCFTDGVGIISDFLARIIIEEMTLDVFDEPSAFQFRMAGCKGVLAVWPQHAKGMEVHIRQSQEKFTANFKGLEIIRCAKFSSATLNRQTITILGCLGVPQRAFLNLLDQQIYQYELAGKDNNAAIRLLTKFVDENQTSLVLAEMLKADFRNDNVEEPFVTNLLGLWRSWSLKLLKEKARIHVEKGAFVLGCVDESGTLRGHSTKTEGSRDKDVNKLPQIFLQLSNPRNYEEPVIIEGVCIVGRNPSLHPGDIRVVQAVDCPALRHLKDVVVFPLAGDRPVPNMLSGGDLDGDDFFVIWDPELIPKEWNHPPMDFTGKQPLHLDRDVHVNDLKDFFVKYMMNDVLPLIATSHLAFADDYGPKSPICHHLAELHSEAVDYPKTGEPADWNIKLQPRKWPHFMEKKHTYKSRKPLGVIFNRVVKKSIPFSPGWEQSFDKRIINRFQLSREMLAEARKVKRSYDVSVKRLLIQYAVDTEFELYSGWAMSRPAVGSDYKRQEDLGQEYDALKQRFRELCYDAAGGRNSEKLDMFVAAMYTVTQEEVKDALSNKNEDRASDQGEEETNGLHYAGTALGGQYKPRKSMLASARRHNPAVIPKLPLDQEIKKDYPQNSISNEEDLEDITKLPNGSVVHQGQPLILFDEEDGSAESDLVAKGSGCDMKSSPSLGGCGTVDGEAVAGIEADNNSSTATDDSMAELQTATDRLASLLGFED